MSSIFIFYDIVEEKYINPAFSQALGKNFLKTRQQIIKDLENNKLDPKEYIVDILIEKNILNDAILDIVIYQDIELNNEATRKQILSTLCHFNVWFFMKDIVKEIFASYAKYGYLLAHYHILKQFDVDFNRLKVTLNSRLCTKSEFFSFCHQFGQYWHSLTENVTFLLLMLLTQSSFYYLFATLDNIYSDPSNGLHIVSSVDLKKRSQNHHSITDNDISYVDVTYNDGSIDIVFKKVFQHLDIDREQVVGKFISTMVLTIELAEEPRGKYGSYDIGIIHWMKENV